MATSQTTLVAVPNFPLPPDREQSWAGHIDGLWIGPLLIDLLVEAMHPGRQPAADP